MPHEIHRVVGFEQIGTYTLRVEFADGTGQVIDFEPVLRGEVYAPLADPDVFRKVVLDPEAGTLVWPNGADFDPAMLHDWPAVEADLRRLVADWPEHAVA